MDYRIVIETEVSGKKWYYIQKRYLFCFWNYVRKIRDTSMYPYRMVLQSLEDVESYIQSDIDTGRANKQSKIIKREYVTRGSKFIDHE